MSNSILELDLSIAFVVAVILIWFMIGYQLILTIAGYFHYMKSWKEKEDIDAMNFDFPKVTILIPAHDEEKVIRQTLAAMTKLDYPPGKTEILVVNDGSRDRTKDIVTAFARKYPRVKLLNVPKGEGGKGKSAALNVALKKVKSEFIAVYDADNTPDPGALRYLMAQLLLHDDLGAVLGKFRTVNKRRNILTRFINVETLSFQSVLQAGRWKLLKISTLPGTNFVIRKSLLDKIGGWDVNAITEDSELSIRVYMEGYRIKFIPYSLTFEQEPESWPVWVRQRTRWVRGNNYVLAKFFKEIPKFKNKLLAIEVLYLLSLYYIFLIAIVISDILFLLSVTNLVSITLPGPYTTVWILAIVLFLLEILLAVSYDREDHPQQLPIIFLMYFTYCQLWMFVVGKALYLDYVKKERQTWIKTIRFDASPAETALRGKE